MPRIQSQLSTKNMSVFKKKKKYYSKNRKNYNSCTTHNFFIRKTEYIKGKELNIK